MNKLPEVANQVEEYRGLAALELLQQHESEQAYSASVNIMSTFFSDEDEELTGVESKCPIRRICIRRWTITKQAHTLLKLFIFHNHSS